MATPNCSNGLNGIEDANSTVCCLQMCGFCGGEGCGNITGTTASDCCVSEIIKLGQDCVDSEEAPCILGNDTNTAAPTMTAVSSFSPTPIDGGFKCLEDRRTFHTVMLQRFISLNLLQLIPEFLGECYRHPPQLLAHFPPRTFSVKWQVWLHPTAPTVLTG